MRALTSRKKEQQEQSAPAFFRQRTSSSLAAAADSFFKPRPPQVQKATDDKSEQTQPQESSSPTQGVQMLVQKQDEGTAPAQQPVTAQTAAPVPGSQPQMPSAAAPGQSSWTPDVPRIWFDLHDFYKALTQPAEPYLYSSFVHINRVDNPNFSNNINPGPVRDTSTVMPGGFNARPGDLPWFFYTKFFVDSAAAPLPADYTQFETSADIRFAPAGGGPGFEDHFVDNNARYVAPGGLSFPFILGTTPYGFRAQHNIMQPGTLQWDARLRISKANALPALRIEYTAPSHIPDEAAFRTQLVRKGVRWRDAAPGEEAPTYRLRFSTDAEGRHTGHLEQYAQDGRLLGTREIQTAAGGSASLIVEVMALVMSIGLGFSHGPFGSYSPQHVEVAGSQRVRFERQQD